MWQFYVILFLYDHVGLNDVQGNTIPIDALVTTCIFLIGAVGVK